jgi:hypothetical protein
MARLLVPEGASILEVCGSSCSSLSDKFKVFSNHPSPYVKTNYPYNPLIGEEWQHLCSNVTVSMLVVCLPHQVIDCFLGKALGAQPATILLQAPLAWVQNGRASRSRTLHEMRNLGKMQEFFFSDAGGLHPVCWLAFFPDVETRLRLMPARYRWNFHPITLQLEKNDANHSTPAEGRHQPEAVPSTSIQ